MRYPSAMYANTASAPTPSSMPLIIAVAVVSALVIIGLSLGLGLGIGLHHDSQSLISVTTTTITTTTVAPPVISIYQGAITTSSASFSDPTQSSILYYYETIDIIPGTTGNYTFQSSNSNSLLLYGYLYNTSFNPLNTATNIITFSDQSFNATLSFNFSTTLQAGQEFILLVGAGNQSATGSFNITVTGPGNITFIRRSASSFVVPYGVVVTSGTDDGSNSFVEFNAADVITGVDGVNTFGYVQQVSLSFSTAPSTTTPMIFLYVLSGSTTTLTFTPTSIYQVPYASITANVTGIQSFSLPFNQLPVVSGQYVAVGLSTGGGSLYSVTGRSQYFLTSVSNFTTLGAGNYTSLTTGIALSFQVYVTTIILG